MDTKEQRKLSISGASRLNHVLDEVPGALDYIVALNPRDFGRLLNPVLRKYMSPRITVRRVAAMARVDEGCFLDELNRLAGNAPVPAAANVGAAATLPQSAPMPPEWLRLVAEGTLHWVDLLPIDAVQGDPMLPVTVAVRRLQPDETIGIKHRWEPQPLYDIWQKMGIEWFARRTDADEWHIFVHKPAGAARPVPLGATRAIMVELRHLPELEAPQRVLVAFEQIRPGESLELWLEPGCAEQVLLALQARHAGEFSWLVTETTTNKQTIKVLALGRVGQTPGDPANGR